MSSLSASAAAGRWPALPLAASLRWALAKNGSPGAPPTR
jgi:hypothetical protein